MRPARTEPGPVVDGGRTSPVAAAPGRTEGPGEVIDADDHLLRRIARGDAGAWPVLVERHLGAVTGFAWTVLGDRAEAEDVAQETFVRLMRKSPDWRPGGAKLRTWIFRVAMNLSTDRWRRLRRA
jgi:RNA polymerase sigma-70 factor (ECF subfamily)